MLKIRLMRIGAKQRPFYRVVAIDERAKRTGTYIEILGTYNPLTQPKEIKLNKERIDYWIKKGAQLSDGYLRMTGKAPQRPPRKPKKEEKKEEPATLVEPPAPETPENQKQETSESTGPSDTPISSDLSEKEQKDEGSA